MAIRKFYKSVNTGVKKIYFELSAPTGTSLVTDRTENILYMKQEYEKREVEGRKLFDSTRAEIYFDYTEGIYGDITDPATLGKVLALESFLDDVNNYLIRGDWLTAKGIADALVVDTVELFTQAFKDKLTGNIDSFIAGNY